MDAAIKAKTGFEECLFVIKKITSDEKVMSALELDDKKNLQNLDTEATKYLEENPEALAHEYAAK